jgi:hypothetical protein
MVQTRLWSAVTSGELNLRCWSGAFTGPELIIGARYFAADERVSIITDDDLLTVRDINNQPDPLRRATYSVRTQNRMIGGQLGFEWNCVVHPAASLHFMGKGAWGPNLFRSNYVLQRGDGFEPINIKNTDTLFSHLYEIGAFLDLYLMERVKLRGGYQALWFVNVAEAVDQVQYNLQAQGLDRNTNGTIFYHGPRVELQIMF